MQIRGAIFLEIIGAEKPGRSVQLLKVIGTGMCTIVRDSEANCDSLILYRLLVRQPVWSNQPLALFQILAWTPRPSIRTTLPAMSGLRP
jgi:hypothetical protein